MPVSGCSSEAAALAAFANRESKLMKKPAIAETQVSDRTTSSKLAPFVVADLAACFCELCFSVPLRNGDCFCHDHGTVAKMKVGFAFTVGSLRPFVSEAEVPEASALKQDRFYTNATQNPTGVAKGMCDFKTVKRLSS